MRRLLSILAAILAAISLDAHAQRQLEPLGRGLVAVRTGTASTYIGWRLLGNDPENIAFNIYRSIGTSSPIKLNPQPLTNTTDFQDTTATFASSLTYHIRPVISGIEQPASPSFTLPPNPATRQYFEIPLDVPPSGTSPDGTAYTYTANDASTGDLDGDGEYEIILRWEPTNSWGGGIGEHTGPVLLDAYQLDGTRLWRINLGRNVNASAHITCFIVYDLDGDGKSEVACMTSDGTIDGIGNPIGNPTADHRGSNGVVLSGPEFLTLFNGQTGAAISSTLFVPQRHPATLTPTSQQIEDIWGDGYGNRVNRFLAGVAYLDGKRPSLIFARGYYTRTVISAWDWRNANLTNRWTFDSDDGTPGNAAYRGQGAHSLSIGDLDQDGLDEISYGACAIDDDGTALWNSGLGHGDATHLTDMDPARPGLEFFMPHEDPGSYGPHGISYHDARTGQVLWSLSGNGSDVGRGVTFDIDPNHPGFERWASNSSVVFNLNGDPIPTTSRPSYNFGVWWDADLCRELLDQNRIDKWVPANGNTTRLLTATGASSNNGTKATPALTADLLGDWREEIILRASDNSALRIYTTTIPASNRIYTLMHDPHYRVAVAWQNSGYNQPPHPGFFLGHDMPAPPRSPIWEGNLIWKGGSNGNSFDTTTPNFNTNSPQPVPSPFTSGNTILFDGSGQINPPVNLAGNLSPASVVVHNPLDHDFTFSGTGSFTGGMSLTKSGHGNLIITGTHPFIGPTIINQGSLTLTGHLTGSPLTIQGYGTLLGTGTLGSGLACEPHSTISPGITGPGTLSITGNTTFNRANIDLQLASTPAATHDRIAITGNLDLSGETILRLTPLGATPTPGTYTLITYTGNLTGSLANLTYQGLSGLPATLALAPNAIVLQVTATRPPASITWRGPGNLWDLHQSENWLLAGSPATFVTGDHVTFDSTGATSNIINLADTLVPASVTLTGPTDYILTGPGTIAGNTSLTKSGTSTLTLATTNSHTGPTSLTGGIVSFANLSPAGQPGPFGSATASSSNLNLTEITLRFTGTTSSTDRGATLQGTGAIFEIPTSASNLIWLGEIIGPGSLSKTGTGTLTLSSANTHSGGTTINAGTIRLGSDLANQSALGSGTLTLAGGTLTMNNSESGNADLSSWPIHVPSGSSGRLNLDGRCTLAGPLTGAGTFNCFTGFVRADITGNWSAFTGKVNILTDSAGGEFRVANSSGMPLAHLDLSGPVTMINRGNSGATIPIGHLTGTHDSRISAGSGSGLGAQNPVTWRIGSLGRDGTFSGALQGSVNLIKEGPGTLDLSGSNTHTGNTTVTGGTLRISGTTTGTTITVQSGGTLSGPGTINGNAILQNNATLLLGGAPEAIETLQINGNLTLSGITRFTSEFKPSGTYQILRYTDTISGTPDFQWSPPPGFALNAEIQHIPPSGGNPGTITLILTNPPRAPAEILWTGNTNQLWDTTTANWTDLNSPTSFQTGDTTRFTSPAGSNITVDLPQSLEPAAIIVEGDGNHTLTGSGSVTGNASLLKTGTGTLTITSAHSFTGGTTLRSGTLTIQHASSLGTGSINLDGGTWSTSTLTPNNPIHVLTDSAISGGSPGGTHGIKAISGSANLTLVATNVFDLEGSLNNFTGRIILSGSGSFRFFGSNGGSNTAFDLGTRSLSARSGNAIALGSLDGSPGSSLTGSTGSGNNQPVTYTIGGNNNHSTFAGTLSNGNGPLSIIKAGTGNITLTGTSTLNGSITTQQGTLTINGSTSASNIIIEQPATLAGSGTIGGNTTCHGTISPTGPLTISGNLTVTENARIAFHLGTTPDSLAINGSLTASGIIDLLPTPGLTSGTHTLITHTGSLVATGLRLGSIPPGYQASLITSTPNQIRVNLTPLLSPFASWQIQHFASTSHPDAAPTADPDHDGTTNEIEFLLDLLPLDPSSAFKASLSNTPTGFQLSWPTAPNVTFHVQRSPSPAGPWSTIHSTNGTGIFTDTNPPPDRAFYRVLIP
jgi:autotransporter-associated beta strand protein